MSKPVLLQVGPYPEWDQAPLEEAFDVRAMFGSTGAPVSGPARTAFLAEHGPEARAIATKGDLFADAEMIAACPKLEIIAVYGVGYDGVDVEAARARGIRVTNTPGVLTDDVADLAVAMWLALSRRLPQAEAWARSGAWGREGAFPLTRRASGKRAGVLGLGRIGEAIARRAEGFGMEIAYTARSDKPGGWTRMGGPVELANWADVLFVACAATAETKGVVGREVIEALGPEGMVVNISRAQNIDEEALIDALSDGRLGGAALDVFEGEPAVDARFADLANVLMQPHAGSATVETRKAMGALMRANLTAHFAGEALPTPVV